MKTTYTCEICGKSDFETERECLEHEKRHSLEDKLKVLPEGTIICPVCKGEGFGYGTDGCDVRVCYICKGSGFVIPKIVTQTIYEPVDTN